MSSRKVHLSTALSSKHWLFSLDLLSCGCTDPDTAASKVWRSVFFVWLSLMWAGEYFQESPRELPFPHWSDLSQLGELLTGRQIPGKLSHVATCSKALEATVVHCLRMNEPLSRKINRVPFAEKRGTKSVCCKLLVAMAYLKYRDIYFQCRSFEIIRGPSKKWVQLSGFSFCTPLRCKFCDSGSKGEVLKHSRDSI